MWSILLYFSHWVNYHFFMKSMLDKESFLFLWFPSLCFPYGPVHILPILPPVSFLEFRQLVPDWFQLQLFFLWRELRLWVPTSVSSCPWTQQQIQRGTTTMDILFLRKTDWPLLDTTWTTLFFFFLLRYSWCTILYVSGVQHSDSQF